MASAMPDLQTPASSPLDQYQIILLGDKGACRNNLSEVVIWKHEARCWTHDLRRRNYNAPTTIPAGHTTWKWIRIKPDLLNDPAAYIVGDVGFNARQDMIPAWPIFAKKHTNKNMPDQLYYTMPKLD